MIHFSTSTSVPRTRIKSVLRGHVCVLLERGQRTNVHRPFTEFHRLALKKHRDRSVMPLLFCISEYPARTSSVYLMILSASDVYIVATKTWSGELELSQNGNTQLAIYRPCGVCEYLLPGSRVIHYWPPFAFHAHSPKLGLQLLARWGMDMSQ